MKLKYKKYIYLINDITSSILNKDIENDKNIVIKLKKTIYFLIIIILCLTALNIYLFYKI